MTVKMEYRASATLRAANDTAFELAGLAAAYDKLSGDLGGFKERIAPGAFTRALASSPDVICCINHDPSKLLGRTKSGTLALADSKEGLRFVCKLDPAQQSHRELYASVKRGDLSECSFAFNIDGNGEKWDDVADERGVRYVRRTLTNLKLHDVSVVCHPAYPGSTSVAARAAAVVVPRRNEKSLEQQFFEKHGFEYGSDDVLRYRLKKAGDEIRNQLRAELARRESDQQLRERVEAAGRRIRVEALIEEMKGLVE
jgi:hypothetical protein